MLMNADSILVKMEVFVPILSMVMIVHVLLASKELTVRKVSVYVTIHFVVGWLKRGFTIEAVSLFSCGHHVIVTLIQRDIRLDITHPITRETAYHVILQLHINAVILATKYRLFPFTHVTARHGASRRVTSRRVTLVFCFFVVFFLHCFNVYSNKKFEILKWYTFLPRLSPPLQSTHQFIVSGKHSVK